ncbi:Phosphoserine phosphatase 1 [Aminobacter sp. MSH1]|uniref:histidine phosphatase family protein n=1 Tax=Aminobacter sp. MSH1 TaxID=374606 RepID=UPI000D390EFE|nr:histidine phosphatase family protein [Aminobacter sp. MSH1]AWC25226.1 Phosphoserine phosphatase 1 [Aminobacter sp. MSH1]
MTHILLTRHGHVEGITPPRFRGRHDLPLTAAGREQARRLGAFLASRPKLDAIYTSPLSRAVDTGVAVAVATNVKATALTELADIDYGDWTGKMHEEVERSDPQRYARWWIQPHLVRPPNGDSLQDLVARTAEAVREIITRHPDGRVVLVGHDSTNRALLLTLLDLPLSAFWRFEQSPCNLTDIEVTSRGIRVHSINETLHLQDPTLQIAGDQQRSTEHPL